MKKSVIMVAAAMKMGLDSPIDNKKNKERRKGRRKRRERDNNYSRIVKKCEACKKERKRSEKYCSLFLFNHIGSVFLAAAEYYKYNPSITPWPHSHTHTHAH